jgi:hypothetical protein
MAVKALADSPEGFEKSGGGSVPEHTHSSSKKSTNDSFDGEFGRPDPADAVGFKITNNFIPQQDQASMSPKFGREIGRDGNMVSRLGNMVSRLDDAPSLDKVATAPAVNPPMAVPTNKTSDIDDTGMNSLIKDNLYS